VLFFKNLEIFDHILSILSEPIFQKALDTAELAGLTAQQRAIYEENLIQYWGMKSALETAVEDKRIEIAKNLSETTLLNKKIAKHAGLTIE
jgi:hypothetical protein